MRRKIASLFALLTMPVAVCAQSTLDCATAGLVPACPFDSGSNEMVVDLTPAVNVEIELPPDGVLRYNQVNIPAGVTVRFKRNVANTPVFLLARGDVTIAGTIDLRGSNANGPAPGMGGPGGFDGGRGSITAGAIGQGPGGGCHANSFYLNNRLVPLLGGSGGNGQPGGGNFGTGGGGGGGSILVASSGTINFSGVIDASGGGGPGGIFVCSGSAGAARLIANRINQTGSAFVHILRAEACDLQSSCPSCTTFDCASPAFTASLPTLRIATVNGIAAPADPLGSYEGTPDITLGAGVSSAAVRVDSTRVPPGTVVTIRAIPRLGDQTTATPQLTGSLANGTATGNVALSQGRTLITAEATVNIVPGAEAPLVIGGIAGERIASVKVGAAFGGASSLVYVTESGREIPASAE